MNDPHTIKELGSIKTGRHSERNFGTMCAEDEPFDYTALLSPEARERLRQFQRCPIHGTKHVGPCPKCEDKQNFRKEQNLRNKSAPGDVS